MSRLALVLGLLAAGTAAQANNAAPGFKYVGCVEAVPGTFGINVDFFVPFSADQCQTACGGKGKYAALGSGCHCDDPASSVDGKYDAVDESLCSAPCMEGNGTAGHCGGPPCTTTGKLRYSLYQKAEEDCEESMIEPPVVNTKVAPVTHTEIQTITQCPPEVTNCPLSSSETPLAAITSTLIAAPAANTKIPAQSSGEAVIPTCPAKCGPPCPPQGCRSCPPEGCLPTCPPGCPMPAPETTGCNGDHCKPSSSPVCPPGGCPYFSTGSITTHVQPTGGPATSSAPIFSNEAARFNSGVLMAVVVVAVVAMMI